LRQNVISPYAVLAAAVGEHQFPSTVLCTFVPFTIVTVSNKLQQMRKTL
jgi:hypothetical protein